MQQNWQNRQITYGQLVRFIIVSIVILIIVVAASLWMMSTGNMIPSSWSGLVAVLFATLSVLFTFFQLVFPPQPKPQQQVYSPQLPQQQAPLKDSGIMVFRHTTHKENTVKYYTLLDLPKNYSDEDTLLFVTPHWDNRSKVYNTPAIGVWYNSSLKQWTIFNQDMSAMKEGNVFNILIVPSDSPLVDQMRFH